MRGTPGGKGYPRNYPNKFKLTSKNSKALKIKTLGRKSYLHLNSNNLTDL